MSWQVVLVRGAGLQRKRPRIRGSCRKKRPAGYVASYPDIERNGLGDVQLRACGSQYCRTLFRLVVRGA